MCYEVEFCSYDFGGSTERLHFLPGSENVRILPCCDHSCHYDRCALAEDPELATLVRLRTLKLCQSTQAPLPWPSTLTSLIFDIPSDIELRQYLPYLRNLPQLILRPWP